MSRAGRRFLWSPARPRWVVAILVGSVVLTSCVNDQTYLPALEADPMANYEADGIELIDRHVQGYRVERPFAQPAKVFSSYRIEDPNTELAFEAAVSSAQAAGWAMSEISRSNVFVGNKVFHVGEGRLIVSLVIQDGEERLNIDLGFASVDESADDG